MTMVDVDNDLYKLVSKFVKKNNIDYPTIQNFVNKSVKNQLRIDSIRKEEENAQM